jgi:hypothetical protein
MRLLDGSSAIFLLLSFSGVRLFFVVVVKKLLSFLYLVVGFQQILELFGYFTKTHISRSRIIELFATFLP